MNILPLANTIFYLLNYSQVKMSADQSTMAVSMFALVLTIPMPASVMRDLYWEQMARRAEVSDQLSVEHFCMRIRQGKKGTFHLLLEKKTNQPSCWYLHFLACYDSKPVFISFPGQDICKSVSHGCEHICVNEDESYVCKCHEGFLLREDGKTCRSKYSDSYL